MTKQVRRIDPERARRRRAIEVRSQADLSPRAIRSRTALLRAAGTVFERDHFHAARIADITNEAEVAHGTFYTYFSSKEAIFAALIQERGLDYLGQQHNAESSHNWSDDPVEGIRRANQAYLESYLQHQGIMIAWEQLSFLNEDFANLRFEATRQFVGRVERQILRLQANDIVEPAIEAHYAAHALCGMVSRFAQNWVRHEHFELDQAVEQLTLLWANALGLRC